MTAEEIVVAALARAMELSNEVPTTRSVHFRRITSRQQQLFVRAAEINPDYFGLTESINLAGGAASLDLLSAPAERVQQVRINDIGTSGYVTKQKVNLVSIEDSAYAGLAPRATLRDYTLTQVGTDLALVTSVYVDYSKRPADIDSVGDVPELPEQFHELLVIDLAKSSARRMFSVSKEQRSVFIELLEEEEAELVADFERHVERFTIGESSRFGRTARPIGRPKAEA